MSRTARSPDFTDKDRALCERLLPHLSRALRLHQRCNDMTAQRQIYANAVSRMGYGAIRVSATGEVLTANAEARRIFEQKDGISISNGHVQVHHAQESRELHRCIRTVTSGVPSTSPSRCANAVLISRPSGRLSIGVVVRGASGEGLGEPLAPHLCSSSAVLMLRDPETDMGSTPTAQAIVKKLFNLSPKESTLALALADGLSIEEAAEHCNISRNTARTYMRAVYLKTGVNRQTDLVRLLINNVVALAGDTPPTFTSTTHATRAQ